MHKLFFTFLHDSPSAPDPSNNPENGLYEIIYNSKWNKIEKHEFQILIW